MEKANKSLLDRKERLDIVYTFLSKSNLPIDTVKLAKERGIKVYYVSWKDQTSNLSGLIKRDAEDDSESGYVIYVNQKHPKTRHRYTIAHEIAHYVLHKELIGNGVSDDAFYRSGLSSKIEAEANGLAAQILMPEVYINREISKSNDGINVKALAKTFDVSVIAMVHRLGLPSDILNQAV